MVINPGYNPTEIDPERFYHVRVLVYTTSNLFSGSTTYQRNQRLLDALNKGFLSAKRQIINDFMPLDDLNVHLPGNITQHLDAAYIRMSSVLFVGEQAPDPKIALAPPFAIHKKKPIQIVVHLALRRSRPTGSS